MSTGKLIPAVARICKHRFRRYGLHPPSATRTHCMTKSTLLHLNENLRPFLAAQISTSSTSYNDKKFGQFLFGRPPEPNLDAAEESSFEDVDPLSREILHKLHGAQTPDDLFEVFRGNKLFMSDVHTSRALQQLAEIWDPHGANVPMVTNQETSLIPAGADFRDLCVHCLRDAQHMDDYTFLRSLHSLLKIGVPENSALIHTLLTQSSHRLNEMSALDFAIFCWIVKSLKLSSDLSHALKKAVEMIIPRMIPKTSQTWHLVAFLQVAGGKLSAETRGRLLNKLLALLKLDPSVTSENCLDIISALKNAKFQSKDTLKEVCIHLHKGFKELSEAQVCQLIRLLGQFKYVDSKLMEKLTDHVCGLFLHEGLEERALCGVLDGLTNGRIHHPELTSLACRYVVEKLKDGDLSVDISVMNSLARYMAEMALKPAQLQEFVSLAAEVYGQFFSTESSMKELAHCLDGFYHLCLLNDLREPCTREVFEERAATFIGKDTYRGDYFQNVVQRLSMLRCLAEVMSLSISQPRVPLQLDCDLPNPWLATQCHNLSSEKKLLQRVLEETLGPDRLACDMEICEGLKADFVVLPLQGGNPSLGVPSNGGGGKFAVNLLPSEGQATNRRGHLVGLYHLKDSLMKRLGYGTFWVDAHRQSPEDSDEESAEPDHQMTELRERLQAIL